MHGKDLARTRASDHVVVQNFLIIPDPWEISYSYLSHATYEKFIPNEIAELVLGGLYG